MESGPYIVAIVDFPRFPMDFPWISMDPRDLQAWAVAEPALIAAQWRNETPEVERPPAPSLVSGHCSAIWLWINTY